MRKIYYMFLSLILSKCLIICANNKNTVISVKKKFSNNFDAKGFVPKRKE